MSTPEPRQSLTDLVEGHYLSQLIRFLHDAGLADTLDVATDPRELAERFDLDPGLLRLVLGFVAARSDFLESAPGGFIRGQRYRADRDGGGWLIDQYLGAYAPLAAGLGEVLRDPGRGPDLVDDDLHAKAYSFLDRPSYRALPPILRELEPNHLVDLGCGAADLLRTMARERATMRGWGLDANPSMCRVAREKIASDGLESRLTILEGSVADLRSRFAAEDASKVDVVVCASLLNQGWASGQILSWLEEIRGVFAGRMLVVADYYGRLGSDLPAPSRLALLHDLVQALSGQGVPPPDREGWRSAYEEAGCTMLHAFEGEDAVWFVHLVSM